MPAVRQVPQVPRQARPKRFNYRKLPVWLQWTLPLGIAAIAIIALVIWVHYETNDVPSEADVNSPNAIVQQNEEADATMRQLQAPQTAHGKPGASPEVALKGAISAWLDHQIKIGTYNGPLTGGDCMTTAGSSAARVAMQCKMIAANVTYPFYGVVVPATGAVTYCQWIEYPAEYGLKTIPVSSRCLGAGIASP